MPTQTYLEQLRRQEQEQIDRAVRQALDQAWEAVFNAPDYKTALQEVGKLRSTSLQLSEPVSYTCIGQL